MELINKQELQNVNRDIEVRFKVGNQTKIGWLTDSNVIINNKQLLITPRIIHRYLPNSQTKITYDGRLNLRKIKNLEALNQQKIKIINFEHFNELKNQEAMDDLLSFNEDQHFKHALENDFEEKPNTQMFNRIKKFLTSVVLSVTLIASVTFIFCLIIFAITKCKVRKTHKSQAKSVELAVLDPPKTIPQKI